MPKTKKNSLQPSFLKREVPKMPEGYYSSGPNPNLAKFVEEHSTPYDPATDDYDVPPFDKPITTTKATAIYNMHTYWSKKPHDAIQQYIRHYTKPGDLVLDPFCGSGGTALAALMEGRKAIAIDLSPAATFITKNYCTPVDVDELQQAFEELKAKVKPEMDWLYETRCDRCNGRATTAYTVYSQVFECPRCLEKVPLFDCPEVASQAKNGKEKMIHVCPYCFERGLEEEISTSSKKFGAIPVLSSYFCQEGCSPRRSERIHNDKNKKRREYFEKYDLLKIEEVESEDIPHWFPKNRMMNVESETAPWGDKWRAGTSNFRTLAELFTKRNLWALSILREETKDIDDLFLVFNSSILASSRKAQYPAGGYIPGHYYLPPIFREGNVLDVFSRIFGKTLSAKLEINESVKSTSVLISSQSASEMEKINSDSIDYIFTDPPYGGIIQYGELNFLWEAWLGFNTDWHSKEVIINPVRGVSEKDWEDLMIKCFAECYRVLKPGHTISVCYHDASEGTWQTVQDIFAEIGFISLAQKEVLYIDTGGQTYNQYTADKVTKRDLLINFRKPLPGEVTADLLLEGDATSATFREKAAAILADALERKPGQPADTLYDELVSRMVRKGSFERHNFMEILEKVAEPVRLSPGSSPTGEGGGVRWYLRETAGIDEAESRKESTVAEILETYMADFLSKHSDHVGVHYSDLFEQYLPIHDKPRRLMQEWLPEYFFKTSEGTWRPAQTDEEKQQKTGLRSSGVLRKIKRFVNALNQGVPPGEKDKPANAATLIQWIRDCRRSGLYDLGCALYEKGGLRLDTLKDTERLEVDEDYQVCLKRGAEQKEQQVKRGKKAKNPGQMELEEI